MTRPACLVPCDQDCESGPVHCEWVHLPSHKPGWHSQKDCPARIPGGRVRRKLAEIVMFVLDVIGAFEYLHQRSKDDKRRSSVLPDDPLW